MLSWATQSARNSLHRILRRIQSDTEEEFVDTFFDSRSEYQRYTDEFNNGRRREMKQEAVRRYRQLTGSKNVVGIDFEVGCKYYALARKLEPTTIIETGVCNGISTLCLLLALVENETGMLHSVDYPYYADESLEEFRADTFDEYGGAAIPSDKKPGWIIPDELKTNWNLSLGKSQRVLPELLAETESVDLFVHDSEHSAPCMMFEYELAWEWFGDSGVLISDDIGWNNSFNVFTNVRAPDSHGRLAETVGYALKKKGET